MPCDAGDYGPSPEQTDRPIRDDGFWVPLLIPGGAIGELGTAIGEGLGELGGAIGGILKGGGLHLVPVYY